MPILRGDVRVYYLNDEYEAGKHKIIQVWTESQGITLPDAGIKSPYSVLEFDEFYNRTLAQSLLHNSRSLPGDEDLPDKYYVDGSGQLRDEFDDLVTISPNPQQEAYKLSALYGLTQEQLETYIESNVTTLASAKEFLKKLSAVVLWLVKQAKLGG